jgi:hypothetical protein
MRTPEITTLPVPLDEYDQVNEAIQRKTSEQYLQDLRYDLHEVITKQSADESLSLRKYLFLNANTGARYIVS